MIQIQQHKRRRRRRNERVELGIQSLPLERREERSKKSKKWRLRCIRNHSILLFSFFSSPSSFFQDLLFTNNQINLFLFNLILISHNKRFIILSDQIVSDQGNKGAGLLFIDLLFLVGITKTMSCSSSSGSESEDDEGMDFYRKGGYHAVRVGDQFAGGRYIAQRKLGWGEFSTVWLAYDTQSSNYVALKIQKSAAQFAQAAIHEIEVLSSIANGDPSNSKCVVRLFDHFKHTGPNGHHHCMVLEFLGDSLLRLIRHRRYKGLELNKVREICKCILIGLDYLHRELGLIHTDLKPENILLCSTIDPAKDPIKSGLAPILERPEGNLNGGATMNIIEKKLKRRARRAVAKISERRASMGRAVTVEKPEKCLDGVDVRCKVVDFGNVCWADKQFAEEIQTRQYRAPEVILRSGYSFSVDMWSFACNAFELATGDMMFAPKDGQGFCEDEDHLALMMELLGKMPKKIAVGGARSKDFFDRHGDLKRIRRMKFLPLDRLLVNKYKFSESDAREFAEFLCPLLDFTPEKRPTAQQCLQHPWLDIRTSSEIEMKNEADMGELQVGASRVQLTVGM